MQALLFGSHGMATLVVVVEETIVGFRAVRLFP